MKIYRFVPNGRDYSLIVRAINGKWWPDGIDLGPLMSQLYPKSFGNYPWPHEGNRYDYAPQEFILSDFPTFALQLPILSQRAVDALASAKLIENTALITVSGTPFYAVQPLMNSIESASQKVFLSEESVGLAMPGGEVFYYISRVFDTSKITKEFFTIPEFEPYSDLYVTERLVEVSQEFNLTGLEFLELVYDNGPIQPKYPILLPEQIPQFTIRKELEWELIKGRCSLMSYSNSDILAAVVPAVCAGQISFEYVMPEYA